jgi:hypothetical protein
MSLARFALCFVLLLPAALLAQGEAGGCKSYEPALLALKGKVIRKTFAGPPNYSNISKGDKAEVYWLLELDAAICVNEDKAQPDLNPPLKDVKTVQLVFLNGEAYKTYQPLVGRRVVATGSLFGAHTAHHHTDALLTVKKIELSSRNETTVGNKIIWNYPAALD